jgi:hypothetical protein
MTYRNSGYRSSVQHKAPALRPLAALFPRSPNMVRWVNEHKNDPQEFLVRTVEFDLDSKHSIVKDRLFPGLWEAAIYSVERMEGAGVTATAYTRTGEGKKLEPTWKTFVRPDGLAVCGAFGLTETGTARAARAYQNKEAERHRRADLPPPPRPMTKADKRRAVADLLTPRLVAAEEIQRAQAVTKTREEKAQLIADLLKPMLADQP